MITVEHFKIMLARTVGILFQQGTTKCVGIIFDDTVKFLQTDVFLVEWSFTIMRATSLLSAPIAGAMMDFLSHRSIGSIGGVLVGLGLLCEAMIATNIWLLFLCNITTGLGFGLELTTALVGLADTFSDDNMYGAMVIASGLVGTIGMAILPLLVEFWRENYGFIWAVALYGALTLNLVPASLLLSDHIDEEDETVDVPTVKNSDIEMNEATPLNSNQEKTKSSPKKRNVIFAHPELIPLLMARFCGFLIITTWAMFLVPSASQKGHPQSVGVFLSTVGGAGVLTGRIFAVILFYFKRMGSPAVVGTALVSPFALILHIYTYDFLLLCFITFSFAACCGLTTSWSNVYVKMASCKKHFKIATVWANTTAGIGTVTLGSIPGFLYHIRESYDDVFAFLAFLSMAMVIFSILALVFTRSNQDCGEEATDNEIEMTTR